MKKSCYRTLIAIYRNFRDRNDFSIYLYDFSWVDDI